jgi:membrane-bound lytic murein transglycosylase D
VILAAGTPQILLPWDNATVFKRNYEAYSEGKFATWTAWSAPSTMSVAEAAKRVGWTETDLRTVNSIPPRMLIKAGSVLIVPRRNANQHDVTGHVADNAQLSLAPEIVIKRTVVKAGRRDTVASIARRYKVSPAQVAEWNGVRATAAFRPGQQVVLHLPVRSNTGTAAVRVTRGVVPTSTRSVPVRASARTPHAKAGKAGRAGGGHKPVVRKKHR